MKIVQIIPSFGLGGAEIMCENLVYSLAKQGHLVEIISLYTLRTPISERLEQRGFEILYLGKNRGIDLSMIPKIAKELSKIKPNVIHMHLDTAKYVYPAVKRVKINAVCVYTVHNMADKDSFGLSCKVNKFLFKRNIMHPVALSSIVQESIASFYGLDKTCIPIVYNGIDLNKCIKKNTYDLGEFVKIIHVGRFSEQKNHKGLLLAFSKIHNIFPNSILQLIGEGNDRMKMEEYAKSLGIRDKVQFLGLQSDVYSFLSQADLFVLPSIYEGIPITIIEAMGSGMPIVATAVGGVPDMLEDNKNALLVDIDTESIVNSCVKLLKNKKMRKQLGQNALNASNKFSSDFMAEQYCRVYNNFMNK